MALGGSAALRIEDSPDLIASYMRFVTQPAQEKPDARWNLLPAEGVFEKRTTWQSRTRSEHCLGKECRELKKLM